MNEKQKCYAPFKKAVKCEHRCVLRCFAPYRRHQHCKEIYEERKYD